MPKKKQPVDLAKVLGVDDIDVGNVRSHVVIDADFPNEFHRQTVITGSAIGIDHATIAAMVVDPSTGRPISVEELNELFWRELNQGADMAHTMVATTLLREALKGGASGVKAAEFWLKNQAGWSDRRTVEHTGADGGAIQIQQDVSLVMTEVKGLLETVAASKRESARKKKEENEK